MRDTEADTGLLIAQVRRALAVELTTLAPDIRHRLQVARRAALARSCAPTWPWLAGGADRQCDRAGECRGADGGAIHRRFAGGP